MAEALSRESLPPFAVIAREWLLPSRTMKRRLWPPAVGLLYIACVGLLGGLRADHVLVGSLGLLDLYNERSRLFLRQFFPFIATGAVYDSMRYFYWPAIEGRVHVAGPYVFERTWFGIGALTPNEWFAEHHWEALDLACGFAYLVFVGEYLALAFFLFFRRHQGLLKKFAIAFFVVNLFGFITYFVYPVAPPWYVTLHGLGPAQLGIQPHAAAAARFDQLLGTHFFDELYGRGIDVYGAYPSLHVAYPLMVVWATYRVRELRWVRGPAIGFFLLMCLSAVYLQHHYVTDVVLGISYALVTLALVGRLPGGLHRRAARASSTHPAASGSPRLPASVASRSASE